MLDDSPRLLRLIAAACEDAEAELPAGTTVKKNTLYAKRLAVQLILDSVEEPKYVAELQDAFRAAMARAGVDAAAAATADEMRAALSATAKGLPDDAGEARRMLLEVEYELTARSEAFYTEQLALLAGGNTSGAGGQNQYDGQAIVDFLSREAGGAPVSLVSLRRIPGGFSKTTLLLEIDAGDAYPSRIVVRLDRADSYLGTAVSDEYEVIGRLYAAGVKVPRPLAHEPTGKVVGDPFIVVAALPGATIGDMFNMPPPNPAINRSVATELAKLHSVPLSHMGDALRNVGTTREQAGMWLNESRQAWENLNMPSAIMDAGFAWLAGNLHLAEGERVVMHGDAGLNNILIDGDTVSALLDWEFVQAGHAGYDIGYFHCMAIALGPWEEFLAAYEEAGGILPSPEAIDFFILFANVRLATMVWQSASAFMSGQYNDIMWADPVVHDLRIGVMRVAQQLKAIRERNSTAVAA